MLVSLLCAGAAATFAKANAQAGVTLTVGLVTPVEPVANALAVSRGVRLGAAEARETATLFGGSVLFFEQAADNGPEAAAAKLLAQRKVDVLVAAASDEAEVLSRFAEKHGVIFINTVSRSSALRAACRRNTFHVEVSDSMYASVLRHANAGGRIDSAVLWDASLERYGASQINARYRDKYRVPMDAGAWAGWVAVKIAAEAALRARSSRAPAIRSYLETPSTSFDGHKGWPLGFRSGDHQLRQPLYVLMHPMTGGAKVRDVPPLTALGDGGKSVTPARLLDQVMPPTTSCVRSRT